MNVNALIFLAGGLLLLIVALVVSVIFRKAIGRSFIVASEVILVILNVFFVIGCGIAGAVAAIQNPALLSVWQLPPAVGALGGFILAAVAGFAFSAVLSAFFFVLLRIEYNTRLTSEALDAISRRSSARPG